VRRFLLVASAVLLVASAALAADLTYRSKNHFSMRVPAGWRRIDDGTLKRTMNESASMLGAKAPVYEAGFEREDTEHPFAYPYVLVQFMPGSTNGAYRDLEEKLMQGVEEMDAKHGAKLNEVLGEHAFDRPIVDKKKNRVWMTMRADTPGVGAVRGILALHLGSKGVAQMTLYTLEQDAEQGRRDLETMSDSFKFEDGHGFGERGLFEGWTGRALIGGVIGLVIALVRALVKSKKKEPVFEPATSPYASPYSTTSRYSASSPNPVASPDPGLSPFADRMTASPFGRPPPKKRVPAEPVRTDPGSDG
jgi:hypothetical protein